MNAHVPLSSVLYTCSVLYSSCAIRQAGKRKTGTHDLQLTVMHIQCTQHHQNMIKNVYIQHEPVLIVAEFMNGLNG